MLEASLYPNHNHLFGRRSCLKLIIPPLPILFGWSWLDIWYYGVRYKHDCHPDDLWSSYFTSSDYVAVQRWLYGEPDVIEVRQTFNDSLQARKWEHKVLRRMRVVKNDRWLNKTDKIFPYRGGTHHSEDTKKRMSESHKGKGHPHSEKTKKQMSLMRQGKPANNKRKIHIA